MKLKDDFITQDIDDTQFLVPIGAEAFQGLVRSNKTAAFIVDCLKEETTPEDIEMPGSKEIPSEAGAIEEEPSQTESTQGE